MLWFSGFFIFESEWISSETSYQQFQEPLIRFIPALYLETIIMAFSNTFTSLLIFACIRILSWIKECLADNMLYKGFTGVWPTGVQLLVFFNSSVSVVLFDTPGISRCRSQHVSVESSSLFHHSIYLWFYLFPVMILWWVRKPSGGPNNCTFWAMTEAEGEVGCP